MEPSFTRAALVQSDITPDFPVELIGGWWQDPVTDKALHPLSLHLLLLETAQARMALVSVDSLGLTRALSDTLRRALAQTLDTAVENVMLSFTHTHEAPAPLSPVNGARYFALLCERAKDCARKATQALRPALAAWAVGHAGIAQNRRPGGEAVDDRLGALRLTDAQTNAPLGLVLRVSAHANILMRGAAGRAVISGDYPALAREKIARRYHCPVMLVQGASGNLKPAGVDAVCGGTEADAARIAALLDEAAARLCFPAPAPLAPRMTLRPLAFTCDVPDAARADAIAKEAREACGADPAGWLQACAELRKAGITTQTVQSALHSLFIAGGCLCGVPEEIFCELALEAQARTGNELLFLNGYTDGCGGYLANASEWDRGGFEVLYSYLYFYQYHGHVTSFRRDTAETIVRAACGEQA